MLHKFRLIPLALLATAALYAATPTVGEQAPDFALRSLTGAEVRLSDVAKKGTVVLLALRGFPGYQCPLCNRQVKDFVHRADAFSKTGIQVVMVYPGPPDRAAEFAADKNLPANFHLLLDADYAFTNLYSLRWNAPNETAYPAAFVLGTDLRVKFAKVSDTHGGRASAAEVLDAVGAK